MVCSGPRNPLAGHGLLLQRGRQTGQRQDGSGKCHIVLTTDLESAQNLAGLNTFDYDSEGRVIRYANTYATTVLTYNGNASKAVKTRNSDKDTLQTSVFRMADGLFVSETFTTPPTHGNGTLTYSLDDRRRLIGEAMTATSSEGDMSMRSSLRYDKASGLVSEVTTYQAIGANSRQFLIHPVYSERENPVALYPEAMQWYSYNETISVTGRNGYSCAKLIDRLNIVETRESGEKRDITLEYSYDFDDSGRLTAIHQKHIPLDGQGNPEQPLATVHFTEIKY